jgi:phosphate transport system substrate-binding protein
MRRRIQLESIATATVGLLLATCLTAGCTVKDTSDRPQAATTGGGNGKGAQELSGAIKVDGSSTVFPITQAVAEEFQKLHSNVNPEVGTSGTGGGFDVFVRRESDINNASRPIKESEAERCGENGIEFIELKVAIDGLSVMVHPENNWCQCLSVEQLRAIWNPESEIKNWNQINSDWPDEELQLFGPDTQSGTFDYFTEEICGEGGASRSDYTASTDDNVLVRGVSQERGSLGYFGYAYYSENKESLKVVGVAPESENCVTPTPETIESGVYRPLSRPLFLYVSKASLKRPEIREFLNFYLSEGQDLVSEVGYVRLSESVLAETRQILADAIDEATAEPTKNDDAEADATP